MRRAALALLLLTSAPAAAGPTIDRLADKGYLLTMPVQRGSAFRRVGLLIALPGNTVPAKLEKDNWAFGCDKNGIALVNINVDYAKIDNDLALTSLQDRIKLIVDDVLASEPSIEKSEVFIGGSSRGGATAIALAVRNPGFYQGVAVANGAFFRYGTETKLAGAKGQYFNIVHGEKDEVIPLQSFKDVTAALNQAGAVVEATVEKGATHRLPKGSYTKLAKWIAFRMGRRPSGDK